MFSSILTVTLVIAFIFVTFGEKLTQIENEQIHQICGRFKTVRDKVMHGTKMDPSQAPWVVPIMVYKTHGVMHCSGTLVSSRHVITARHCFVKDYNERYGFTYVFNEQRIDLSYCSEKDYVVPSGMSEAELHFGTSCRDSVACESINRSPNLVTRKIAKVVLPGICAFNGRNGEDPDDFAIIEIDRDILFSENIHPLCIPNSSYGLFNGANVTIFGFGSDPSDEQVPTGILKYESSAMARCQFGSEKYVCSLSYNGKQLACKGDSGGGVVFEEKNSPMLVAVLSRGEACSLNGQRYNGDILAPVYVYLKEICKYAGICQTTINSRNRDTSKLYGHETAEIIRKEARKTDILIMLSTMFMTLIK